MLAEFPSVLKAVEDATQGVQDFLGVSLTRDNQLLQQCSHLPLPLNTLFRKLYHYTQTHEQIGFEVSIKGDFDQVEAFYERYSDSQIMSNTKY